MIPFRSFDAWADDLAAARHHGDWVAVEVVEKKLRCIGLLAPLIADGWYLRADIVWDKPNAMPENVGDRPTISHEYVFLLSKEKKYLYDADAIAESALGGRTRNARSVWGINTQSYAGDHPAVMSSELARRCVVAGSKEGDIVVDPFSGVGTSGVEALGNLS